MILAMNIGNTNFTIGSRENGKINTARYTSATFKSKRDFIQALTQFSSKKVNGVIISSVKPELTDFLIHASTELYGFKPVTLNADIKSKCDFSNYDTTLIGSDRIAVCEAAVNKYSTPAIIFDFGTAVTVNVIDKENKFLGGAILPGIAMGLYALSQDTSMLPKLEVISEAVLIGQNTRECLISGAVYGNASMLDGMVNRIETHLGYKCVVLVTGGNGIDIIPFCGRKVIYEKELLIEGLLYYAEEYI